MKKLFLLSAILALSASSFAQTEPASSSSKADDSERLRFGIKAGYVLSNIRISGDSYSSVALESRTTVEHSNGFYVGGTISMPLGYGFAVQSGLSLIQKGANFTQQVLFSNGFTTATASILTKYRPWYLELPINLIGAYPIGKVNVYYGIGPFIAFGIGGKLDRTVTTNNTSLNTNLAANGIQTENRTIKYGSDKDMRSIDFGANILLGVKIGSHLGIDANYSYNFANALGSPTWSQAPLTGQPIGTLKGYNGVATIGLSYEF